MTVVSLGVPRVGPPDAARRAGAGEDAPDLASFASGPLADTHGRVARDLRVSLTDRCNLRCHYCMPPEGLPWLEKAETLDDAETIRLVTLAVRELGVDEVRFTGGEPLLRRGLEDVVAATAALTTATGGRVRTSLTTNGIGLARRAAGLAAAGLGRINVSLDSLRPERFAAITRRDRHADVLAGLRAAQEAGLTPVKVNTVLLRGVNDDEAADLLGWALREGYRLRFIEQMPLDPHGTWQRADMITGADIHDRLVAGGYRLTPLPGRGSSPAEGFAVEGPAGPGGSTLRGEVGLIASVTAPFCGDCDRTRLTADGQVRTCLFSTTETDLRDALRGGADDAELAARWRRAMWGKLPGHDIDDPAFLHPTRPMSSIGG
ncbi:GTP 3',8-cyclase MoaA [Kineococcus gynurae]|uniref:GTP 3',8-cyclase n=1 Tax=Kineococcus gynurae TaxID=452979 RepID=A0ABV5LWL3_9ACTN